MQYQISSTLLCTPAIEAVCGWSVQWHTPPRFISRSKRISEPSGALTSIFSGVCVVCAWVGLFMSIHLSADGYARFMSVFGLVDFNFDIDIIDQVTNGCN